MYYQIFIQSLAIVALIIWVSSYHFKTRKSILLVQLISFIFLIAHFVCLGVYTGAFLVTIAVLRLAVFSFKKQDNWISKPIVFWVFISMLVVATLLTLTTYWALFALAGGIFATVASWQYNQTKIRILFIPGHILWIIYDVIVGAYGAAITEAVLCVSAILSLLRKDLKENK